MAMVQDQQLHNDAKCYNGGKRHRVSPEQGEVKIDFWQKLVQKSSQGDQEKNCCCFRYYYLVRLVIEIYSNHSRKDERNDYR